MMKSAVEVQKGCFVDWVRAADKTVSREKLLSLPLDILFELYPDTVPGGRMMKKVDEAAAYLRTKSDARLGELALRSLEDVDLRDWSDTVPKEGMEWYSYIAILRIASGIEQKQSAAVKQEYMVAFAFIAYQYLTPWLDHGWGAQRDARIGRAKRALFGTKKQQLIELFRFSPNNKQTWEAETW